MGQTIKQECPQALGRSPENDCLEGYRKALPLLKSSYMNVDRAAVSLSGLIFVIFHF